MITLYINRVLVIFLIFIEKTLDYKCSTFLKMCYHIVTTGELFIYIKRLFIFKLKKLTPIFHKYALFL